MRPRLILALAVAALTVTTPAAAGVRDLLGREVPLAPPVGRVVSLVPSVTEIVYALGGQDRLVGVTDFCDWPPAARAKPSVGGMLDPSLETIVTLRPDVVVATTEGNRQETFAQLERLGIPVFLVRAHRIAEMLAVIARLGELTGRREAVGPLVERLQGRIAAVQARVGPRPRPRVLYVLWPQPLLVPGRASLVTELIDVAGGESVTRSLGEAYPRFSVEAAVARRPEVILLADHGAGADSGPRERWGALASLPPFRGARVHSVSGNLLHRYGPRVVEGLEALARAIHPEAFR